MVSSRCAHAGDRLPVEAVVTAVEDSLAAKVHARMEEDVAEIEDAAGSSGGATGATDVETELDDAMEADFFGEPFLPFGSGAQAHFCCPVGMFLEYLWNAEYVGFGHADGKRGPVHAVIRVPCIGEDDAGAPHFHRFEETDA